MVAQMMTSAPIAGEATAARLARMSLEQLRDAVHLEDLGRRANLSPNPFAGAADALRKAEENARLDAELARERALDAEAREFASDLERYRSTIAQIHEVDVKIERIEEGVRARMGHPDAERIREALKRDGLANVDARAIALHHQSISNFARMLEAKWPAIRGLR